MLLDATWTAGLVYYVVNITLIVLLLCLVTWIALPKRSTGLEGAQKALPLSGALAALLQAGSVALLLVGIGGSPLDNRSGVLPRPDKTLWGSKELAICATDGILMAYSRQVLVAHLTLLAFELRQVGLHESETPTQSNIIILWPWLYGFLHGGSMIAAFGVSKFDTAFFAWNGLGCAAAGLRWRIVHIALLAIPTLGALYFSGVPLIHFASTGAELPLGGGLMTSMIFEQITWGQDTWIRALQEPVVAVTFITLWILSHKQEGGRSHFENRNGSPLQLPNAQDSAQKQRRSSFFPPALIVDHPSRPAAVAIPSPLQVGSHDFSQTPDSGRPFHFDDLSSQSGTLSPCMTPYRVKSEALDVIVGRSDATSSVYSLPSYKSHSVSSLISARGLETSHQWPSRTSFKLVEGRRRNKSPKHRGPLIASAKE